MSDVHTWVLGLLPDVPPHAADAEQLTLLYRNTLTGTQLSIE
jgi:hypothetical protein